MYYSVLVLHGARYLNKIKAQHLLDEFERSGTLQKKLIGISKPIWC